MYCTIECLFEKKSDYKLTVYFDENVYKVTDEPIEHNNIVIKKSNFSNKNCQLKFFFEFSDDDYNYYLISYQYMISSPYSVESNTVKINKKNSQPYYFTNLESKDIDKEINGTLLKKIYGDNYLSLIEDEIKEFSNYIDKLNNTDDLKNSNPDDLKNSNPDLFKKLKQINKDEFKNIKKTTNYYFDIFIDENDILKISYKVYLCYNNYIIISKDIFNLKSNSMIQDEPKCIIYINNLRKNYYLEKKDESYSIVKSLKFCFNEQVKMYYLQFKELNEEVNQDNQLNIEHTELINRCIETQRILITTKNQEEPNFSLKKSDCKLEVYLNDDLYDKGNSLAIENSVITTVDFSNKDLVAKLFVKFLYNDNDCYLMSYQKNSLNISSSSNGYGVESNIMMINKKDKTYYFTNLESKDIDKKINDALLKKIYGDNYLSLIEDEIKEFNNYIDKLNNTDDLKNSNSDLLEKLKQIEKYEFKDIEKITNYYFDIFIDNNEIIKIDYKVCFNKTNSIIISRNIFNLKSSFEIQNNESQYIFCFNNSYFKREYTSYNIVNPFKFNLNYRVEEEKYLTLNEKNTADIPLNQFFITKYKEISIDPTQIIDKPINTEKSNYILICMIIFILLISSFLIFKKVKDSSINKNEENISIEE